MKILLHPCYILHQRPYRETSIILEVLSRNYGKVSLVARGAKKGVKNNRSLMQCNQKLNIAWTMRGEMGTLTAIEAVGTNYNLTGKVLIASFYINELLMRLLHKHEPHPELFDAYDVALMQLRQPVNEQSVLRIFEKRLLDALGYGLVLDHDVMSGKAVELEKIYYYQMESGPSEIPPVDNDFIKVSGQTLAALNNEEIQQEQHLAEARRLTRKILKYHLGEKPLASRELFRAYLRNQSG